VLQRRGQDWEHIGFVMRKVSGDAIHSIYSPKERKVNYPEFTWINLIQLAKNAAAAFHYIHSTGTVMGDVNESNFLVDPKTGVTSLIDCDSYQVTFEGYTYRCPVGVGQWTPPELHGANFDLVDRSVNHDLFGLAVLIFQLLFIGRHPFSSQAESDLDKAIQQHLFSYSEALKAKGVKQPSNTLANRDVSAEVFELFERAFLSGSSLGDVIETCSGCQQKNRIPRMAVGPQCSKCGTAFPLDWNVARPNAEQWYVALSQMEARLSKCKVNTLHFHLANQDCPFCRLDKAGAPVFNFKGIGATGVTLAPDVMVVQLWQDIRQIPAPVVSPLPPLIVPRGTPIPSGISKTNPAFVVGWIVIVLTLIFAVIFGASALWIGVLGLILISNGQTSKAFGQLKTQRISAVSSNRQQVGFFQQKLSKLISDRVHELNGLKLEAEKCYKSLLDLPTKQKQAIQNLESRRHDLQLEVYLDKFFVSQPKIKGLGPKRIALLQAYGIETAWDVRRQRRPSKIPEQVWREIIDWSAGRERGFKFNPAIPVSAQDVATVNIQLGQERLQLQTRLKQFHTQGIHISKETAREKAVLEEQLCSALQSQKQAEADLLIVAGK
jgi:DNA-binding helix-hairpin-helix protein with protein kinase domain